DLDRSREAVAGDHLAERRFDVAPALARDQLEQLAALRIGALVAEQAAEGAVALGDLAVEIEQRDPDRRVLEDALEAPLREAERLLPFALGRQVADHRAGAQAAALGIDDALADIGLERPALHAAQGDLA